MIHMNPKDILVVLVLILVLGLAVFYIVKKKKSGAKCIGCPYASACGNKGASSCNCNTFADESK